MDIHANAALGPAGGLALVQVIESGMTLRAAAAALNVSPATAHRLVASLARRRSGAASLGRLAARPALHTTPPAQAAIDGRGGADPEGAPTDRPWPRSPGGSLSSSPLDGLEGPPPPRALASPEESATPIVAMSGLAPAPCCTWTSSAWPASVSPVTLSPVSAKSAAAVPAGNTCTSSSTTTRGWPTWSATRARV
jgi:hypothetical protein